MADPKEVEAILETKVSTPRSPKDKKQFSDFIRRISQRPEISGKTDEEIANGIRIYLEKSNKIQDGKVLSVPTASEYNQAVSTIQTAKKQEASRQQREVLAAESVASTSLIDEERASWQAIQDAIAKAKEQDRVNQAQRQEVATEHASASTDLEKEYAQMLAETRRAFETEKDNIEREEVLRKQEQLKQEALRLRTAQVEARSSQRSLPEEKQKQQLLTEAEKEGQQRKLKDQQAQKKQTQALIERLVAREAKKGQAAADAKRAELHEKYKDILSVPDAQVPATADQVQKAREMQETARIERERLVVATEKEKEKQQQQHQENLKDKRDVTARKEADIKAAEAERKQKEESKRQAPLLIKWHEPGPLDLLRPDPTISKLESQRAQAEVERKQKEDVEENLQKLQTEKRRALGQEKLNQANTKMKVELKASVYSGKLLGMFGGYEEKRDMAIDRLTDLYCKKLSESSKSLEALSMEGEEKNLVQHNVAQMGPKIEKFCQEHKDEPVELFHKNMETWAEKEATECAEKSNAVMSLGFKDKYPDPPQEQTGHLKLEQTFTHTEGASTVKPLASPHNKHDKQQHGK